MRFAWMLLFLSGQVWAQLAANPARFPWATPGASWPTAALNERCPNKSSNSELEASFVRAPEALIQHARSFGPQCLRSVAEKYIYHAANAQQNGCTATGSCSFWSSEVQTQCAAAPASDETCALARTLRERTTALARELIFQSTTHEIPRELTNLVCEQLDPVRPLAMSAPQELQGILQEFNCAELAPGQSRAVAFREPLQAAYVLERTGDNSYRARININLRAADAPVHAQLGPIEERMRACMQQLTPVLRGPGGETLELALTNPAEVSRLAPEAPRPQVHDVTIHSTLARADSGNYPASATCPLIAHEVLHLLGLVDEYHERDPALGYECRVHPTAQTIMANHETALSALGQTTRCTPFPDVAPLWRRSSERERQLLSQPLPAEAIDSDGRRFCRATVTETLTLQEALQPGRSYPRVLTSSEQNLSYETLTTIIDGGVPRIDVLRVDCDCVDAPQLNKCIAFHQRMPARLSSPPERRSCPPIMRADTTYGGSQTPGATSDANGITITTRGSEQSLLAPGHFQSIIAGSCSRRASDYRACAAWAYRRECGEAQASCFGGPEQCPGPPAQCTDERFLGTPSAQ